MNIFEDIKNGVLPEDNMIIYVYENNIKDFENQEEIKKYIEILNNSFSNATLEEKILINKVLFVLNLLINNNALEDFILKSFTFHVHQVDKKYSDFLTLILNKSNKDIVFEFLNKNISNLINYNKQDLRSYFNWILHFLWNIENFHNNKKFMLFYDSLKQLIYKLRDSDRIDEMMYVEFFTYHIIGNSFQTMDEWREFNKNVTQETIKAYDKFVNNLPSPKKTKKSKKRIAFVKPRTVFNSPFMVEYSLFKNLMENKEFRDNYEIYYYSFNQFEKSYDDENVILKLNDLGIKVRRVVDYFMQDGYYYNHLDKALTLRQNIIEDEIDVMIAGGVYPIFNFLYVTRTAPLQIYYSHGNCAYDVPNIDKRISHFEQECKEFEWNIINIPFAKEFLIGTEGEKIVAEIIKQDYKNKFGEDVVILGTIGRLVKIDSDEYIKTIAEIMKQNPNTIYLACGVGNEENIKEKLKKYNIDEKRFIFTGMVKAHVYGWVIDVWPDSFPQGQGQSKDEFIAKKRPVIFHIKRKITLDENNRDFVALRDEEYIEKVTKLIHSDKYRKHISQLEYKLWYKNKMNVDKFIKLLNN